MLRSIFIALSQNRNLRSFSERSSVGRKMSGRFVAGMSVDDVLAACERVNRKASPPPSTRSAKASPPRPRRKNPPTSTTSSSTRSQPRKLNANVSVKLSQVGMDFDPALAERIVGEMVEHAAAGKLLRPHRHGGLALHRGHHRHDRAPRTQSFPAASAPSFRPTSSAPTPTPSVSWGREFASASARAPTKKAPTSPFPPRPTSTPTTST